MENEVIKMYPEFGLSVKYTPDEDMVYIDWVVLDADGDILMTGRFDSKDYYKSTFTVVPSNIEENTYENLFYLYFENIKLTCIDFVEFKEESSEELVEEM